MSSRNILYLILALFAIATAMMISVTPYRTRGFYATSRAVIGDIGAPDEDQHANYVAHLLDGKGFPVLHVGNGNEIEFHQPPLYYLMAAGTAKLMGSNPLEASGKTIRYLNILFGAGTLVAIYFAALWGLKREDIGLGAAGIAGLMPMFVALHSGLNNDPLLICLCSWVFALCVKAITTPAPLKDFIIIGVLLGLALLTKSSALALFPVVLLTAWWVRKDVPLLNAVSPLLIGLVIAAPWLMRNQSLYGDPLALKLFETAFAGSPHRVDLQNQMGAMTYWTQMFGLFTAKSFIGVFGYMDIFMSEMVYRLALVLLGICAAGWAFSFRAPAEEDGDILVQKRFHILGGCFAIVVFLLYLKFNLTYFQAQARYLYPAIAPISIGLATGLMFLIKKRNLMIPAGVATLLFLGNMAINSFVSEQFQMRIDAAKELDAQK